MRVFIAFCSLALMAMVMIVGYVITQYFHSNIAIYIVGIYTGSILETVIGKTREVLEKIDPSL